MYLYGKNSVLERLKANPKSIRQVFLQDNFDGPHVVSAIKSANIPIKKVTERQLLRIKRADRLQGIVAESDDFKYADFDELLYSDDSKAISFICLDGINDPHNLGSIIRTAACFGNFAVAIPMRESCEVNDTVIHVASGGENFIPVCLVNNMSNALLKAKDKGFWLAGAVVGEGQSINKMSLPFPMCLVLGSEGKGIRPGIKKHLDIKVRIPMKGSELSFNVAIACAIFCYEIDKQRQASP